MKCFSILITLFLMSCAPQLREPNSQTQLDYLYGRLEKQGDEWVPLDERNQSVWLMDRLNEYDDDIVVVENKIDSKRFHYEALEDDLGRKSFFQKKKYNKYDERKMNWDLWCLQAELQTLRQEKEGFSKKYKELFLKN